MREPEFDNWQRTSPFAILFFLGRTVRLLAQNSWQALAPLVAVAATREGDLLGKAAFAGGALAAFVAIAAILSYWFFRFRIDTDAVRIHQGVFRKKQLDIRFDRIQGINTEQNPVYRALGLVTVSFDTAGSSGSEGNLPAVPQSFPARLRKRIGRGSEAGEEQAQASGPAAPPLLTLGWRDMIRIGLADRRVLVVFAIIGPFAERIDDRIEQAIRNYTDSIPAGVIELGLAGSVLLVLGLVAVLLVLFALLSIAAAFLKYHGFELTLTGRTLHSTAGLLTRHEHSLDLGKIQMLILRQGIVQRWQRRFSLVARQAVSGRQRGGRAVFTIPAVDAAQADRLRRLFLDPEAGRLSQNPHGRDFVSVSPRYLNAKILFGGLLPALAATGVLWPFAGMLASLALAWAPLASLAAWQSWRRTAYCLDGDEIIRRSGLLGYRTTAMLHRKVQRITIRQSRYQRRHGLASLRLYSASGSLQVPYLDHALARQLRDYVLYRVESSELAWH